MFKKYSKTLNQVKCQINIMLQVVKIFIYKQMKEWTGLLRRCQKIYFSFEPEQGRINMLNIEDHISGMIYKYGWHGYKQKFGGYKFELDCISDTSFTSKKLGYDIRNE